MMPTSALTISPLSNSPLPALKVQQLELTLRAGDIVFTRIGGTPFRQIADATGTWTNHVGIVVGFDGLGAVIAESRVPLSRHTRFTNFACRSAQGRVAVLRLREPLSDEQIRQLQRAAGRRLGRLYDTGFSLGSRRQFCSRFVREVLQESTGVALGEVMTLRDLLERNPETDLRLWKAWYFGRIPWERATVTPASLYASPSLTVVFDGTTALQSPATRSSSHSRAYARSVASPSRNPPASHT
jgi:Permuted papain-like amidase enzyme, YaeF/YiiX, C92 family